jgi:uncharacterized damage-inducible protein DinB
VTSLGRAWQLSWVRLEERLVGLDDEEYFWEPVARCWTVRRDTSAPSGWQIDYEWPAPEPPPFTTIAWRMVHVANGNWIYWEHAFGPAKRNFIDLEVPGSAATAITYLRASREPVTRWLATATEADLAGLRTTHLGMQLPAIEIVGILIDEQTHHGAEIGLLRDLRRGLPTLDGTGTTPYP